MPMSTTEPSALSRDSVLTLRRVERQQHLIERLCASSHRLTFWQLADRLGVAERTIARDIARLRDSGVPITVTPGRGGGAMIDSAGSAVPIEFEFAEVAALMASLASLGPTVSESAAGAMAKLAGSLS